MARAFHQYPAEVLHDGHHQAQQIRGRNPRPNAGHSSKGARRTERRRRSREAGGRRYLQRWPVSRCINSSKAPTDAPTLSCSNPTRGAGYLPGAHVRSPSKQVLSTRPEDEVSLGTTASSEKLCCVSSRMASSLAYSRDPRKLTGGGLPLAEFSAQEGMNFSTK
jgi:hypothetical protein